MSSSIKRKVGQAGPLLASASGVLALVLPKCPLCFVGYCAALSAFGIDLKLTWWFVRGVSALGLALSWLVVGILSAQRRDPAPIALSTVGLFAIVGAEEFELGRTVMVAGLLAVFSAAWLNAFRCGRSLALGAATRQS